MQILGFSFNKISNIYFAFLDKFLSLSLFILKKELTIEVFLEMYPFFVSRTATLWPFAEKWF